MAGITKYFIVGLKIKCAFANDFEDIGGGSIIVGVEEKNGKPVLPLR